MQNINLEDEVKNNSSELTIKYSIKLLEQSKKNYRKSK